MTEFEKLDYQLPDKGFWIHQNDPDLIPIWFDIEYIIRKNFLFWNPNHKGEIPILNPNPEKVAGWGLPREEQYFRKEEMPVRLKRLEKQYGMDTEAIWEFLHEHHKKYEPEIEWIKTQWYHLLYGYWFFCNGKMTYIDGWHWHYLNYHEGSFETIDKESYRKVNSKTPEYRDRDRRKNLMWKYSLVATESFERFDDDNNAIPDADGNYRRKDLGIRVWYGSQYPKPRRDGATVGVLDCIYCLSIVTTDVYSSMIGNRDDTAKSHFNMKLVPFWRKQPFFFKPIHSGTDRPKSELSFTAPASKVKKGESNRMIESLEGKIDYADVATRAYYDHAKITGGILLDEEGKTLSTDIYEGWGIVKPTMSQGGGSTINPHALAFHPSTVEEMEGGGGSNYKALADDSNFYQRNPKTGQTRSGLFYFFIPSSDGLENFVGKYGESIIETPTPEQAEFIGRPYGAKQYIQDTILAYSKANNPKGIAKLEQFKRQHPEKWADCWKIKGGEIGFNTEKLETRLKIVRGTPNITKRVSLLWLIPDVSPNPMTSREFLEKGLAGTDVDKKGKVIMVPDDAGRFRISMDIPVGASNLKVYDPVTGHYSPKYLDRFILCSDPVQYNTESESKAREDKARASHAAGALFYPLDKEIDDPYGDMDKWKSNTFVGTYMEKPDSDDEYAEDMLMWCLYWGAMCYPEVNIPLIVKHMTLRGYKGYLKYDWLDKKSEWATSPGFRTGGQGGSTVDELFSLLKTYIEYHIHRECHEVIIYQLLTIKRKEDMKRFDMVAAAGGALRGDSYTYRMVDDGYDPNADKKGDDKAPFNLSEYYGRPR